jgi:hypothetical protein
VRNKEMSIPEKCGDCEHRATDSCRDIWWWVCGHDVFEIGEEPTIEIDKPPILKCPLRSKMRIKELKND